jgi:hypothetical protein
MDPALDDRDDSSIYLDQMTNVDRPMEMDAS